MIHSPSSCYFWVTLQSESLSIYLRQESVNCTTTTTTTQQHLYVILMILQRKCLCLSLSQKTWFTHSFTLSWVTDYYGLIGESDHTFRSENEVGVRLQKDLFKRKVSLRKRVFRENERRMNLELRSRLLFIFSFLFENKLLNRMLFRKQASLPLTFHGSHFTFIFSFQHPWSFLILTLSRFKFHSRLCSKRQIASHTTLFTPECRISIILMILSNSRPLSLCAN